ncbi:MAG: replication protein [Nanoarchaeota archaeon]|mgnify:FL=1
MIPQIENGFIQISTELWKALGSFRISGEEYLVLNCIIGKTYGFHKKEDKISLSQIVSWTGLAKSSIIRARKKLIERNIIIYSTVNSKMGLYAFNKLYSTWKTIYRRVNVYSTVNHRLPKGKSSFTVLSKDIYTKDTITKDTITKDICDDILSHFNTVMGTKYKSAPKTEMNYWLEKYTVEEIKKAIEAIPYDQWLHDKKEIVLMFRRRNKAGDVDHIGRLLSLKTMYPNGQPQKIIDEKDENYKLRIQLWKKQSNNTPMRTENK